MTPGQVDANASRRPKGYLVRRRCVFLEELRYMNMNSSRGRQSCLCGDNTDFSRTAKNTKTKSVLVNVPDLYVHHDHQQKKSTHINRQPFCKGRTSKTWRMCRYANVAILCTAPAPACCDNCQALNLLRYIMW